MLLITDNIKNKIQIIRAIAIIAVVFIHTAPIGIEEIFVRPFINFAVAMFLFLSGLLTPLKIDNVKTFYQKRLTRVIIPYIIWTIIYSVIYWFCGKHEGILYHRILYNLFTAKACFHLYYIFVYIQFVLITPFLKFLVLSKYRYLGLFISPIASILLIYIPCLVFHHHWSIMLGYPFLVWFTFYYLGLLISNNKITVDLNNIKWYWYFGILFFQEVEGFIFYSLGIEGFSTTQIKITSIFTSVYACLLCYKYIINGQYINNAFYKVFVSIGNYSFGIYLIHLLIIDGLHYFHILRCNTIHFPFYSILIFILTYSILLLVSKICGGKISKWFGFI